MQNLHLSSAWKALFVSACISGCSVVYSSDLDAKQCTSTADCEQAALSLGAPLVCETNVCVRPTCATSAQCPSGSVCENTVCVAGDGGVSVACTHDSECGSGKRCGFDNFCYEAWGCLAGDRDWLGADANATYRTTVRNFIDITKPELIGPLTVKACGSTNPSCTPPFVASSDVIIDSVTKNIAVPFRNLPANGFIGSVNVEVDGGVPSDGGLPAMLPGHIHFTTENPMVSDLTSQTELFLASPTVVTVLAAMWQVSIDPGKATMVLQVHDCGGRKAPGVSIAPVMNVPDYLFVPIAGKSMPILGGTKTTEDGAALAFNLPGNSMVFVLRNEDLGQVITDRISIPLRAATLNYFVYYPRRSAVTKWMTYAKSQGLTP